MGNPLIGMMGNAFCGGNQVNSGNNPLALMQQFQNFRKQFPANANPQQILNQMVQSGRTNQAQINQAIEIGKQMGVLK
jgi:hypothetical protein